MPLGRLVHFVVRTDIEEDEDFVAHFGVNLQGKDDPAIIAAGADPKPANVPLSLWVPSLGTKTFRFICSIVRSIRFWRSRSYLANLRYALLNLELGLPASFLFFKSRMEFV